MTDLSIQQILSSRFRTSGVGDSHTKALMEDLGLSTKANVARLAIGRSLSAGPLADTDIDAKGLEIPATSLFTQDDVSVWVGLLISHAQVHGTTPIQNMEGFRAAVRKHWHRGVQLLIDDWETNSENYDSFLSTLINRRANLPDVGGAQPPPPGTPSTGEKPQDVSLTLKKALVDIGVSAEIKGFTHGPRVTRYRIFLPDINDLDPLRKGLERLSLVLNLHNAVATLSRGDEAKTVFLDVPRPNATWLHTGFSDLRSWIATSSTDKDRLLVYPGVDVMGKPLSIDLVSAPHLLVGGATGTGKSVCLHALIMSLLMQHTPDSLQLALIDPKQVEFSVYKDTKYLYGDGIAIDSAAARASIQSLVEEMERRYEVFSAAEVTNIGEAKRKGMKLPFIVAFIEELADLIMQHKSTEPLIVRLAQKARAAGIHLVLATQRPDAKTFSGLIRSNIPTRIALTVQKSTESTIILDETGAESLLGSGDMLIKKVGDQQLIRGHGVYLTRDDIAGYLRRLK